MWCDQMAVLVVLVVGWGGSGGAGWGWVDGPTHIPCSSDTQSHWPRPNSSLIRTMRFARSLCIPMGLRCAAISCQSAPAAASTVGHRSKNVQSSAAHCVARVFVLPGACSRGKYVCVYIGGKCVCTRGQVCACAQKGQGCVYGGTSVCAQGVRLHSECTRSAARWLALAFVIPGESRMRGRWVGWEWLGDGGWGLVDGWGFAGFGEGPWVLAGRWC